MVCLPPPFSTQEVSFSQPKPLSTEITIRLKGQKMSAIPASHPEETIFQFAIMFI